MIKLPQKIIISNNTTKQAFKYFIPIIATFWVTSFAFSGKIQNGIFVGVGSVLLCALIIILVYKNDKKNKRTIELTDAGILEIKNNVRTFIGWGESHQTYYDGTQFMYAGIIPVGAVVSTQVVAKGRAIKIDWHQNNFHKSILSLSFNHVFPLIQKQLLEKKRIYFGPVELDEGHIYIKDKQFSRKDIEKIKVVKGKLIVKFHSNWLPTKIMVRDVPNLSCLVKLIDTNYNKA